MESVLCSGRLVPNFSLEEMCNSQTKQLIKLVLTPAVVKQALMMQELRDWWGKPMTVNSWYREKEFNDSVGGDPNSCHLDGIATDIALGNLTTADRSRLISKWREICVKYKVIGGASIYEWGLHFDSNNDPKRYGHYNTSFRVTDFRK